MIITPSAKTSIIMREELASSFSKFTKFFFQEVTHQDYLEPDNRQAGPSVDQIMFETLTQVFNQELLKVILNFLPRVGKTTKLAAFFAWYFALVPISRHLFTSANDDLCEIVVHLVKSIMSLPIYRHLFGNILSKRRDRNRGFLTKYDGELYTFGLEGALVGRGAGLPGYEGKPSGVLMMDDWLKGQSIDSEAAKRRLPRIFQVSVNSRVNNHTVPKVYCAQVISPNGDDFSAALLDRKEGFVRRFVSALDENDLSIDERRHPREELAKLRKIDPTVFYTQFQQHLKVAEASLFDKDNFVLLDKSPEFTNVFIVADTGESDKVSACDTVFTLFGTYNIQNPFYLSGGMPGLHIIDAAIIKTNPAWLVEELSTFFTKVCQTTKKIPPIYIEKKSTGTMLISILQRDFRGVEVYPISRSTDSKFQRFSIAAPYCRRKLVSFPTYGDHTETFIDQCTSISTYGLSSGRRNDCVDTLCDAIRLVYEYQIFNESSAQDYEEIASSRRQAEEREWREQIQRSKRFVI